MSKQRQNQDTAEAEARRLLWLSKQEQEAACKQLHKQASAAMSIDDRKRATEHAKQVAENLAKFNNAPTPTHGLSFPTGPRAGGKAGS